MIKIYKYLDKIIVRICQQPFALSLSKGSCYGSTSSPRTEKYCINFVQVLMSCFLRFFLLVITILSVVTLPRDLLMRYDTGT